MNALPKKMKVSFKCDTFLGLKMSVKKKKVHCS